MLTTRPLAKPLKGQGPLWLPLWPRFEHNPAFFEPAPVPTLATFTSGPAAVVAFVEQPVRYVTLSQYKKSFIRAVLGAVPPVYRNPDQKLRVTPALDLTTPLVLAAAAVPQNFRHASIARILLTQALRRALILVANLPLCLTIQGVFPNFVSFWSRLNRPSEEVFAHPLSEVPVFDLSARVLENQTLALDAALGAASYLDYPGPESLSLSDKAALLAFFSEKNVATGRKARVLKRYSFEWAACEISLHTPHGWVRTRRRRSIKKRLAKRLTKLAMRRFWVL